MGYTCSFCGKTVNNIAHSSGNCNKSPSKDHQYMAQHPGDYICKYCGDKRKNIMHSSGSCNKSPFKAHEYM